MCQTRVQSHPTDSGSVWILDILCIPITDVAKEPLRPQEDDLPGIFRLIPRFVVRIFIFINTTFYIRRFIENMGLTHMSIRPPYSGIFDSEIVFLVLNVMFLFVCMFLACQKFHPHINIWLGRRMNK